MRTLFGTAPALVLLTLVLGACGGGDVDVTQTSGGAATGPAGAVGSSGLNALVAVSAEGAGANCVSGGNKIEAGLDRNGNGALGRDEVATTQFVCNEVNVAASTAGFVEASFTAALRGPTGPAGPAGPTGATGARGLSALVQMISEPVGANCAAGGRKVNVGVDVNANQILEASEISSTAYVCNGTNGTNGANGSNGLNTLMTVVAEHAGANCAYGGSKASSGLDANASGLLDAGEVVSSSYVCNGAPGSNGGTSWWNVSGSAVQAQPNSGYITSNDSSPVVVTLPTSPTIGDTLRISGAGAGGWTLAQNAGQLVSTKNLGGVAGLRWTARDVNRNWRGLASSADGARLVAVVNNGQIYTSTDSGATWTARDSIRNWYAVTSSADGSKLAAVVYGGQIYTSTDSGISWVARETARNWTSIASSSDGSRLVATVSTGFIYTSTDSGITWTQRATSLAWQSAASSADGLRLVAVTNGGQIWTSVNGGTVWTARGAALSWYAAASSSDGTRLVAVVNGGQIWTSTDIGVTWTARESARSWQSVASSADGLKLVAAVYGGQIYASMDGGVTWTTRATAGNWVALASSADGSKLSTLIYGGQAYTSIPTTSLGESGYLRGNQYDAIELQYLGGGLFGVLSHEGSLVAY